MSLNTRDRNKSRKEYGDWQTPIDLARDICSIIADVIKPQSIFEPNCGVGNFIQACVDRFPEAKHFLGLEINPEYVMIARNITHASLEIIHGDFFNYCWSEHIKKFSSPLLIIGNPPWVTNSELMRLQSNNLPNKTNIHKNNGIDALTGKGNFDISEWMIIKELEAIQKEDALLSMLCKTNTARKVLAYAWKNNIQFSYAEIRGIDAKLHFDVSVDACLLLVRSMPKADNINNTCAVYASLKDTIPKYTLGIKNGRLVSNTAIIEQNHDLINNQQSAFSWRSGIKHDCSKIMELIIHTENKFINGHGEFVDIEDNLLFPMLKSSDLANRKLENIDRMMLVTQQRIGSDTSIIATLYPKTWKYLRDHSINFEKRGSIIYKNRPQFSVFGIGEYTFKPWKVAISGLYKSLNFQVIGPFKDKPVVFDDTCYFLACESKSEATLIKNILESEISIRIFNALIFWDSKRPITKSILDSVDIVGLSHRLGFFEDFKKVSPRILYDERTTLFST